MALVYWSFLVKINRLKAVHYFCNKELSKMFDKVLNTPMSIFVKNQKPNTKTNKKFK